MNARELPARQPWGPGLCLAPSESELLSPQALASYKCSVWVIWCPLRGEPEFQKPGWGRGTLQRCASCATHRTAWPKRLLWRDTATSVTTSVWALLCLQTGSTRLPKCSAKAEATRWAWRPLLRHTFCQKLLPRGRKTLSQHMGSSALCHLGPQVPAAGSSSPPAGLSIPVLQPRWPERCLSLHQWAQQPSREPGHKPGGSQGLAPTLLGTPFCN